MASPTPSSATRQRGASFLLEPAPIGDVFTPERFTDEHRMIARTAEEFLAREVVPQQEAMEHDPQLNVPLLKRAGALGLLAVDIDEAHGGLGLDKVSSTIVAASVGACASFSVSHAAQVCIGTLPVLYFGTAEQKARYLPKLASGEMIAAYALTEPGAGSDALSGRTSATLSPDGTEWILSGTKMWITNAGFADLFTVFAKIDGEHFSAFLVERTAPGLSFGNEERKMGIKGSSTRAVNLEQVRIPVGNLLGAKGQGARSPSTSSTSAATSSGPAPWARRGSRWRRPPPTQRNGGSSGSPLRPSGPFARSWRRWRRASGPARRWSIARSATSIARSRA